MKGRERLLRTYRGEATQEVPWAPLIFDDTLSGYPQDIRRRGAMEFTRTIGGDILWRLPSCTIENQGLDVTRRGNGSRVRITYQTKAGSLTEVLLKSRFGSPRSERYPIEEPEDYHVLEQMLEEQVIKPAYGPMEEADGRIGESGIIMTFETTSPVQSLIQRWMGLKRFYLHLLRHRSDLEGLISVMHESNREIYRVMAESPAEVNCIVENTDIRLTSPEIYRRYCLEHVKDYVDAMHRRGKIAIVHMCGRIGGLLQEIRKTGLDGIDCLTPRPTGDLEFTDAYRVFGDGFVIHGVLDPSLWMPDHRGLEEIRTGIERALGEVQGRPFVLCTAADGIPGIPIRRFKAIGHIMVGLR